MRLWRTFKIPKYNRGVPKPVCSKLKARIYLGNVHQLCKRWKSSHPKNIQCDNTFNLMNLKLFIGSNLWEAADQVRFDLQIWATWSWGAAVQYILIQMTPLWFQIDFPVRAIKYCLDLQFCIFHSYSVLHLLWFAFQALCFSDNFSLEMELLKNASFKVYFYHLNIVELWFTTLCVQWTVHCNQNMFWLITKMILIWIT